MDLRPESRKVHHRPQEAVEAEQEQVPRARRDHGLRGVQPAGINQDGGEDAGQGVQHPLAVGHDDVLYIGDRRYLHAYDGQTGADGTFSIAALRY